MDLITPAQRDELFDGLAQDAFHLELRDDYGSAVEDSPYGRWKQGRPDDLAWLEPWMARIRRITNNGRTVRRVRVVSQPHSTYVEWEHALTPVNLEIGEDIRWLPRHLVPVGLAFPLAGNDWWLFDDRLLAVGHFDTEGRVLGSELVDSPSVVADCARVRDQLWSIAIPHAEYRP